jgi:hypothetical protein
VNVLAASLSGAKVQVVLRCSRHRRIGCQVVSDAEYCFPLRPCGARCDSVRAPSPQGWHSGRVLLSIQSIESRQRREARGDQFGRRNRACSNMGKQRCSARHRSVPREHAGTRQGSDRTSGEDHDVRSRGATRSAQQRPRACAEAKRMQNGRLHFSVLSPELKLNALLRSTEYRRQRLSCARRPMGGHGGVAGGRNA